MPLPRSGERACFAILPREGRAAHSWSVWLTTNPAKLFINARFVTRFGAVHCVKRRARSAA